MHTHLENVTYTSLLNATSRTGGTATSTYVAASGFENHVIKLSLGTVTAGSVTQLEVLEATNTGGSGAAVISGATLSITDGTADGALYAIEVGSDQLSASGGTASTGTAFIGARVIIPSGGTATYAVELEQVIPRRAPTANGLSGSALQLV